MTVIRVWFIISRRSEAKRIREAAMMAPAPVFTLRHYQREAVDRIWSSRQHLDLDPDLDRIRNRGGDIAASAAALSKQPSLSRLISSPLAGDAHKSSGGKQAGDDDADTAACQDSVSSMAPRLSNWVVVAPTNSGKTAIFIEVTK